jgi:hypothetical protein
MSTTTRRAGDDLLGGARSNRGPAFAVDQRCGLGLERLADLSRPGVRLPANVENLRASSANALVALVDQTAHEAVAHADLRDPLPAVQDATQQPTSSRLEVK